MGPTGCCVFATFVFVSVCWGCVTLLVPVRVGFGDLPSQCMCNDVERMNVLADYRKTPVYSWT